MASSGVTTQSRLVPAVRFGPVFLGCVRGLRGRASLRDAGCRPLRVRSAPSSHRALGAGWVWPQVPANRESTGKIAISGPLWAPGPLKSRAITSACDNSLCTGTGNMSVRIRDALNVEQGRARREQRVRNDVPLGRSIGLGGSAPPTFGGRAGASSAGPPVARASRRERSARELLVSWTRGRPPRVASAEAGTTVPLGLSPSPPCRRPSPARPIRAARLSARSARG